MRLPKVRTRQGVTIGTIQIDGEDYVSVLVAGCIVYDGPSARFDPDYGCLETMIDGASPEIRETLREHLSGKGRSYIRALKLLLNVYQSDKAIALPLGLRLKVGTFLNIFDKETPLQDTQRG